MALLMGQKPWLFRLVKLSSILEAYGKKRQEDVVVVFVSVNFYEFHAKATDVF